MREQLLDIITHSYDLKIIDKVLVTSTDESTIVESMDVGRCVIMKGKLNDNLDELKGTFGMSNLETLKGYCNFANYKTDDSKITVKRKEMNGEEFPEEFIFTGGGTKSNYRCMLSSAFPTQPNFRGSSWDIDITISKSKILEFAQLSSILKEEEFMYVELSGDELKFYIGAPDSTENHAVVVMAEGVEGNLRNVFQWKISHILSIARLSGGDVNFRMLSKGLININVASEYGEYDYYLPRRIVEEQD